MAEIPGRAPDKERSGDRKCRHQRDRKAIEVEGPSRARRRGSLRMDGLGFVELLRCHRHLASSHAGQPRPCSLMRIRSTKLPTLCKDCNSAVRNRMANAFSMAAIRLALLKESQPAISASEVSARSAMVWSWKIWWKMAVSFS